MKSKRNIHVCQMLWIWCGRRSWGVTLQNVVAAQHFYVESLDHFAHVALRSRPQHAELRHDTGSDSGSAAAQAESRLLFHTIELEGPDGGVASVTVTARAEPDGLTRTLRI
jgi:hypothetical protein